MSFKKKPQIELTETQVVPACATDGVEPILPLLPTFPKYTPMVGIDRSQASRQILQRGPNGRQTYVAADTEGIETVLPMLLTLPKLTAMTGIGRTRAFALMNEHELQRVRIGRRTYVTMASVEGLIARAIAKDAEGGVR